MHLAQCVALSQGFFAVMFDDMYHYVRKFKKLLIIIVDIKMILTFPNIMLAFSSFWCDVRQD